MMMPPPLCAKIPGRSPAVEQVVFKAFAKDPAGRYENVTTFANALQDACRPPASIYSTTFVPAPAWQAPLPSGAVSLSDPHNAPLAVVTPHQPPAQATQCRPASLAQSPSIQSPPTP